MIRQLYYVYLISLYQLLNFCRAEWWF